MVKIRSARTHLDLKKHDRLSVTISTIGIMECEVDGHHHEQTRLKFLKTSPDFEALLASVRTRQGASGKKH